jgi:lysophospholipid acyltransferase (LPLAT)-like uncharacterized protein
VDLAGGALPALYRLYMAFVWRTSRIEQDGLARARRLLDEHGAAVALVWHDEVLAAAWAYPHLGLRPLTLVSVSRAGEIATRLLERCGYEVVRGGASRGRSRRRSAAWRRLVRRLRRSDRVLCGVAVDGSHGPRYRLKRGALVLARASGKPLVLARTTFARSLRLPTWDRTALPLPFGRIRYAMRGPYFVPDSAGTREGLERFRRSLEAEMIDLTAESFAAVGRPRPADLARPACAGSGLR